jgi:hypothetical protein
MRLGEVQAAAPIGCRLAQYTDTRRGSDHAIAR